MARTSRKDERVKKIIETTYELFLEKGIDEIGVREIAKANDCETASLYFFMDSRENVVQSCIDYGLKKIETEFFNQLFEENYTIDQLLEKAVEISESFEKDMRFIYRVCTTPRYSDFMREWFSNSTERYDVVADCLAKRWNVDFNKLKPILYLAINVITDYMLVHDKKFTDVQFDYIKEQVIALTK